MARPLVRRDASRPCVRFAPSPTGFLHLGNARIAVVNWLFARHGQGPVRPAHRRHRSRAVAAGLRPGDPGGLSWLGLGWDASPAPERARRRYAAAFARLRDAGLAYACFETPEELAALRERQRARGLPPRYERPGARRAERRAARGDALLAAAAAGDGVRLRRSGPGPAALRRQRPERPGDPARGRQRHLSVRLGGRRCRARDQPCHPRRGPCQQHGAPAGDPRRHWRAAAALRPSAADRAMRPAGSSPSGWVP